MKHDAGSLTLRLEAYLLQLSLVTQRWTEWLRGQEQAAAKLDLDRLQALHGEAQRMLNDLMEMRSLRQSVLDDALQVGLPATNLQTLARRLPAWRKGSFRATVRDARLQLANLRRVHMAAWVFIHQLTQFYAETLAVLGDGSQANAAYIRSAAVDTSGGNLLDRDL
jgi:hypothetical protein